MKHASLAVLVAVLASGCGSDSSSTTTPTPTAPVNPTFTATLSPANETPAITNAESVASGSATVTFVTTKDANGVVTSAVGTAVVNMQGFPAGSNVTLAHIHTGASGVAGPVLVGFVPSNPPVPVGSAPSTFTQTTNITGTDANNIMNSPAGFYFNVHTSINPGGVMRGQLVRTQ